MTEKRHQFNTDSKLTMKKIQQWTSDVSWNLRCGWISVLHRYIDGRTRQFGLWLLPSWSEVLCSDEWWAHCISHEALAAHLLSRGFGSTTLNGVLVLPSLWSLSHRRHLTSLCPDKWVELQISDSFCNWQKIIRVWKILTDDWLSARVFVPLWRLCVYCICCDVLWCCR